MVENALVGGILTSIGDAKTDGINAKEIIAKIGMSRF